MPIPQIPDFLPQVLGQNADVFNIPMTSSTTDPAAAGALNYATGWPQITAIAPEAGGLAPEREYFNAVNKLFSQHLFFQQSGGVYPWNAGLNYLAGAHVLGSDGNEYIALTPSGPDVPAVGGSGVVGPVDPVNDTTGVWGKTVWNPAQLLPAYPPTFLTASGVWTAPESRYYWVTVVGGGGGGGGGYNLNDYLYSGAGGGSGYIRKMTRWYNKGRTIDFVVGAGGAGGAPGSDTTGGGNGGDGGDSVFDELIAQGGKGGGAGRFQVSTIAGIGGVGRISGPTSRYAPNMSTNQYIGYTAADGYSDLSISRTAYGTGGIGGTAQNNNSQPGGAGASGAVIIE